MRFAFVVAAFVPALLSSASAQALQSYPAELSSQFVSWCTQAQGQPQTVCSCAVNKAALEIPAAAMASFLSAAEGGGVVSMTTGVGATSLQIVTTCAAGAGGGASSALKSLGGAFGQ